MFFTTEAKLVGQDGDELSDLYDARIDGGFPAPRVDECIGEACQGASPNSLGPVAPASLSSSGTGNLAPSAKSSSPSPPKPLTRAQKLVKALTACAKDRAEEARPVRDDGAEALRRQAQDEEAKSRQTYEQGGQVMRSSGTHMRALLVAAVAIGASLLSAPSALAGSGPIWSIQSAALPTSMQTSDDAGALVRVSATGGTFTLSYEGQTTAPIAYDASSATVESALDALSSIGGVGGSATVKGGHGGPLAGNYNTTEYPYGVMFEGKLHGVSAATITADNASLTGGEYTVTVQAATNDEYDVHVENIGDTASSGTITFTDKLPTGVTTTGTSVSRLPTGSPDFTCSAGAGLSEVVCTGTPSIPAGVSNSYDNLEATIAAGTFAIAIPVRWPPTRLEARRTPPPSQEEAWSRTLL